MKRALLWAPPAAYAGLIFFLSSRPVPESFAPPQGFDKLAHLVLYAGLGVLLARAFAGAGCRAVSSFLWATLAGALYGVSDEVQQSFVPARSAEVLDAVADAAGSALGAAAYVLAHTWWSRRRGAAPPTGNEGV